MGALGSIIGASVSFADSVGFTPPALLLSKPHWTLLIRVGAVPVEFIAAVWFVGVADAYRRWDFMERGGAAWLVLVGAAAIAGVGGWLVVARPLVAWPIVVAVASAGTIAVALATHDAMWTPGPVASGRSDPAVASLRVWAITFVALSVIFGAAIHGTAASVRRVDANRRVAVRWYQAQAAVPEPGFVGNGKLRVVVFTDYQTPSARKILRWIAVLDGYRGGGAPIEFVPLAFPFQQACNSPDVPDLSSAGCDAAYAVKLLQISRGEEAASAMSAWLYRRGPALSASLIQQRIAELGLAAEWSAQAGELRASVARDVALARRAGVRSVPTVFVNGVRLPPGTDMLEPILEYEVSRLTTASVSR